MSDDLCFLSIAEAARLIASRKLSPVELVDAYLDRIARINPQIDAFVTLTPDLARRQARAAEAEIAAGRLRGPLHGMPLGVKDIINTKGILTTAQSKVLANNVPTENAAAVTKIFDAGAVLLGKLTTHEFAHGGPSFDLPWPPARNPWNTAHYSGGSSSGAAAGAAAGLVAGALGTDTGGSVRSPSWLCGTVGLKPTFGLVSRTGVIPFSESCDHVGPMSRTVEDSAILLQAIAGHDARDPGSSRAKVPDLRGALGALIKGLRIGVVRHFWTEDSPANKELAAAVDTAITLLRDLGAIIEEVRLRPLQEYYAVRIMLTESEIFALHQAHLRRHAEDYGRHFLARTLAACLFTSADYIAAQRERKRIIREMRDVHRHLDALLTAGAGPAPKLADHRNIGSAQKWLSPGMGPLFSLTGAPAIAVPCGFSTGGLPFGMQIAGRPFEDATVLRIAHAYEQAAGWFRRRPALRDDAKAAPIALGAAEDHDEDAAPEIRALADAMARRAGLELNLEQRAVLYGSAPHALALADRVRRAQEWTDNQAATFTLAP